MKKFKEFNESAMDFLKPKSEEEILKSLEKMDDLERSEFIIRKNLPKKYLPDNYDDIVNDMINSIKNMVKKYGKKVNDTLTIKIGDLDPIYYPELSLDSKGVFEEHSIKSLCLRYVNVNVVDWDKDKLIKIYEFPYEKLDIVSLEEITFLLNEGEDLLMSNINEGAMDFLKPKSKENILKELPGNPNIKFKRTNKIIYDSSNYGIGKLSFPITYDELVKLFGEPEETEYPNLLSAINSKTHFRWVLESDDKEILIIYDYCSNKTKNELKTQSYEWKIRGNSKEDFNNLIAYIVKNTIF